MKRREFLRYCIAALMAGGFSGLSSCSNLKVSLSQEDKALLSGLTIADAHAHPYQLYGSSMHDSSTPTIDMMKQVGMVACSFSALGDRVKYGDVFGAPFGNTMDQLKEVKIFEKNKRITLIRKASDIPWPNGLNNVPGAVMTIEGGDALEGKINNLNKFYEYGVRMITIMHATIINSAIISVLEQTAL